MHFDKVRKADIEIITTEIKISQFWKCVFFYLFSNYMGKYFEYLNGMRLNIILLL